MLHAQDTLKAGAGLCEPKAVNFLVTHAAAQVDTLLQMGIAFDRRGTDLAFTLEAAHSHPRVLHAADTTGKELVSTLARQLLQRENITVWPDTLVLNLWVEPQTQTCRGFVCCEQEEFSGYRLRSSSWLQAGVDRFFPRPPIQP